MAMIGTNPHPGLAHRWRANLKTLWSAERNTELTFMPLSVSGSG